MMEFINILSEFIKSVGFPIAAFVLVWYDNRTTGKHNVVAIESMKDSMNDLKTVTGKLVDHLNGR